MKKLLLCLCALIFAFASSGCKQKLQGMEELVEKAREVIPIAQAESMEIRYAGLCAEEGNALIWFISGNEYQAHCYLPMECEILGENEYAYTRTYKPMERGLDIAVLQWQGGYSFLINNPNCKTVRITQSDGTVKEFCNEKNVYPYLFYYDAIPAEYVFLDEQGKELP